MENKNILITDPTLRDGNHAIFHQLNIEQISAYCLAADLAGVPIVEVGHGNGLAASSLQVGLAFLDDATMLKTARDSLKTSKLGIHAIPGFATVDRDIRPAIEFGVDVFRIASHCTEADTTRKHIEFCRNAGKEIFGVLMMTHMADKELLAAETKKMQDYGAEGVILMDSAGSYLPSDVTEKVSYLVEKLQIPVGFHAHNNLGMGVANSVAAVQAGATMLDGCSRGFGAGAGNAQLEVLVAVLDRMGYQTGINLSKLLDASDLAEKELMKVIPTISSVSVVSGLSGVVSGFLKHVNSAAKVFNLDPRDIFFELGRRKVVAGQEDIIIEVAKDLNEAKIKLKINS